MRGIPIAHARWIGSLLNRLSDEQLHAAFRAAALAYLRAVGDVPVLL